ncbi:MAG: AAA family ATPase [Proteobacteria bacterium]|nr:AAA family ATPase [Pseudomonadota bacterium]
MKIVRFFIDGFGIFHNVTVKDLQPGFTLFIGDNEAGKSTCLSFLRDILFGFSNKVKKDNIYPPLAGGRQGGSITVAGNFFGEAVVERRSGKKGGSVTVTYADGRKGTEEELHQILGNTTRELFKNIYAFSLNELQTIDTLDNESVKNVLYSAGIGTAMLSLPKAITGIETKMGEMFKPGGRNPLINQKLVALEAVRASLRQARTGIELYDAASEALEKKMHEIDALQEEQKSVNKEKNLTETYLKLWNNWISLEDHQKELSELPLVVDSFPENGVERLDRDFEKLAREKDIRIELVSDWNNLAMEIKSINVAEKMLSEAAPIRTLLDKKEGYIFARENMPIMSDKLELRKREIFDILNILGKDWTEERISKVDRSLFTREAILKQQRLLETMSLKGEEAQRFVKSKQEEYETALAEQVQAQKDVERYLDMPAEADEKIIIALQKGRDQFASIARDLPQRVRELEKAKDELVETIKEISPEWTETNIIDFDCSISAQQKVQSHESALAKADQESTHARMRLESVHTELKSAREKYDAKARELENMEHTSTVSRDELTKKKSALLILKSYVLEHDHLTAEIRHLEERLSDKRQEMTRQGPVENGYSLNALKLTAFIAVILGPAVFGILAVFKAWTIGMVTGGMLVVIGAMIFFVYRNTLRKEALQIAQKQAHLSEIEQQVSAMDTQLLEMKEQHAGLSEKITGLADELGINIPIRPGDMDSLETGIDEGIRISDNKKRLIDEVQSLKHHVLQMEQSVEIQAKAVDNIESILLEAKDDWEKYLGELGLQQGLLPGTVYLIFTKIETVKTRIKHIDEIKDRIALMEETKDTYLTFAKDIPSLAVLMGKGLMELLSGVDLFLQENREMEKRRHERILAEEMLAGKKVRTREIEDSFQEAADHLREVENNKERARASWQDWLEEHDFDYELSPAIALEAFQKIDECIRLMHEKAELTAQIIDKKDSIETYLLLARTVFERLGEAMPETQSLLTAIDRLGEDLDETKANRARKEELSRKMPGIEAKITLSNEKIAGLEKEIDTLIKAGGSEDQETFRTRGRFFAKRADLLNRISEEERALKFFSGEEDIAALKEKLKTLDNAYLNTAHAALSEQIESMEIKLNHFHRERADLSQEISRLASADDISRLRTEEEGLLEEIRLLSRDWACYAIARFLLGEARKQFEQEQQPRVIHDAGTFFQTITGGQYEKIIAPIGEGTIDVITRDGQRKQPEELSRGTAEQLYLAIRFGYISNFTVNGEKLPVIIDDILVNFDPGRARQTAKTILRLSETHQVLFFTCHPETAGIFRENNGNIPVYKLQDGTIKGV